MTVAYGKITPTSAKDEEVKYVRQRFVALAKAMRPGAYLVDSIPWLRYLPWYGQDLKQEFKAINRFYTDQLNLVKQQIVRNVLPIFHVVSDSFHRKTRSPSPLRSRNIS